VPAPVPVTENRLSGYRQYLDLSAATGEDDPVTTLLPPGRRREELAAFLRTRRARIRPEDVGLPPGPRRRTPGLRREEVAQLAGVGVTWYTWLEQGRPINASVQVLDAIARTLKLDSAECEHLYRLADLPWVAGPASHALEPETQAILDAIDPLPAAVYSTRYDLLAHNRCYQRMFPGLAASRGHERNVLWHLFTCTRCCTPFLNRNEELPVMVANVRTAFGRHLGDPVWTDFVRRLSAMSPPFASMWAAHNVAIPSTRIKLFRHDKVGLVRLVTSTMVPATTPETRLVIYLPRDESTRARLERLLEA
jgi:transcriptional regulator with XRE-family HTH domain